MASKPNPREPLPEPPQGGSPSAHVFRAFRRSEPPEPPLSLKEERGREGASRDASGLGASSVSGGSGGSGGSAPVFGQTLSYLGRNPCIGTVGVRPTTKGVRRVSSVPRLLLRLILRGESNA